jgi:hypothetical protein
VQPKLLDQVLIAKARDGNDSFRNSRLFSRAARTAGETRPHFAAGAQYQEISIERRHRSHIRT